MSPRIDKILSRVRIGDLRKRRVSRVGPATSLEEVYRLLDEEHSVAVLVCEGDRLLGIFTERDILYRTALEGGSSTPIGELMTSEPICLPGEGLLADAIRTMVEKGIRHVPLITEEGNELGLIGGRDVLELVASYFPETFLNLPPRLDQTMHRPEGG